MVMAKGGFLPCVGMILDHYNEQRDSALLVVCNDCKHYRLVRCNDSTIRDTIRVQLCTC